MKWIKHMSERQYLIAQERLYHLELNSIERELRNKRLEKA
jgi:hypothetical protein